MSKGGAGGKPGMMGGKGGAYGFGMRGSAGGEKNHGCQANLCCGNTHEGGIWSDNWVCNTKTATTYNDFRFACYEGAKNIAASAVALLAASYMMA